MIQSIKFVYNDVKDLEKFTSIITKSKKDIKVETFSETKPGEKRKALILKSQWGTKIAPLIVIYNDNNKVMKVFYREQGDNLYLLDNFLNHPKKVNDSFYKNFINQCKDYDLSLTDVIEKLNSLYYETYN